MTAAELRARLGGLAPPPAKIVGRPSAVLIPIEPEAGVWLTRRTNDLPNHAGQVSFPGGKIDPADASPEAAALREAHEEIGLDRAEVEVLGRLDDYITGTGFFITPVTALVPRDPVLVAAASEVADIFRLDFDVLLDPAAPQRREAVLRGVSRNFWVWPHPDHVIWGATAEILVRLAKVLRGD
jgi:8-oxo-dGTP pyrophosphatase MutT (NUDIX family)